MNLPSGSSRRKEAHSIPTRPPGKRSEPRYLGCYVSWVGSRPQCASGSWRSWLSMNLPSLAAADVRRLTLSQRVLRKEVRASLPRLLRKIGLSAFPLSAFRFSPFPLLRQVILRSVILHHAPGVELRDKSDHGAAHHLDPLAWDPFVIAFIKQRDHFLGEHAIEVFAVDAILFLDGL